MGSERAELAAARVRAAAHRAEQLRERIIRLQAGIVPTREDVERARAAAETQRNESDKAHQRLLLTYAAAGDLRWRATSTPSGAAPHPGAQSEGPPADHRRGSANRSGRVPPGVGPASGSSAETELSYGDTELRRLSAENRLLRDSLVSIASVSGETGIGWSRELCRPLWQALVDQCGQESWQGWAHALCVAAASTLSDVRGVAISGYDDRRVPHLLAVTNEWTRQVEEIHQLVGEGPAVEAYGSQAAVMVRCLEDEQGRWPGYVSAAADSGLSGVCALPIMLNGVCLGSLTLYRSQGQQRGQDGWLNSAYLAAVATKVLLADLDAVEDGSYPWHADDHQIQVAVGMLLVQLDATVDEALALMRAFAFSNARGLVQVANAIVDGSLRLT